MKFDGSRRKVLALLGAAPAAPLAAKAIIDKELAALSGVLPGAPSVRIPYGGPCVEAPSPFSSGPTVDAERLATEFFELFGLPEHVEDDFRRQAASVSYFDPDIAAKRSWSNSVKIATQRERNLSKLRDGMRNRIAQDRKAKAFRQIAGFSWPFYY